MSRQLPRYWVVALIILTLALVQLLPHFQPERRVRALTPTLPPKTATVTERPQETRTLCPLPTPPPLYVSPVDSPTSAMSQTISIYTPGASKIVISSEAGDTTYTGPGFAPALVTIPLLPDTIHHLQVVATFPERTSGGCTYPSFSLNTRVDTNYDALVIVQGNAPTLTTTPDKTLTPYISPTRTPLRQGANLLRNPSFEFDANHDGEADSWGPDTFVSRSSAAKHSGRFSLRHYATGGRSYVVRQHVGGIEPGKGYWMQGWVNITANAQVGHFSFEVRWRNSRGQAIRTDYVGGFGGYTAGWSNASRYMRAPRGAASAVVRMNVQGLSGTIYVDDMVLRREMIPTATAVTPEITPTITPTPGPLTINGYVREGSAEGPGVAGVPIYLAIATYAGTQRATTDQNGYYEFQLDLHGHQERLQLYTEPRSYPYVYDWMDYGYGGVSTYNFITGVDNPSPTPYEPTVTLDW